MQGVYRNILSDRSRQNPRPQRLFIPRSVQRKMRKRIYSGRPRLRVFVAGSVGWLLRLFHSRLGGSDSANHSSGRDTGHAARGALSWKGQFSREKISTMYCWFLIMDPPCSISPENSILDQKGYARQGLRSLTSLFFFFKFSCLWYRSGTASGIRILSATEF